MTNLWETGDEWPEKYIVDAFVEKMRAFQSELTAAESAYPQLYSDFLYLHGQVEDLIRQIESNREESVGEFDEYIHGKRENEQEESLW